MRFPSRLFSSVNRPAAQAFAFAVMVAALASGAGCEDKHIGRPCELGASAADAGSGSTAVITSPALECPSRICLLPGAEQDPGNTSSLCTASCTTDDDCADAEGASATDSASKLCKKGFFCTWPTTVGPFCCQKMCVCRDFVAEDKGGSKLPQACTSRAVGGCQNVQ